MNIKDKLERNIVFWTLCMLFAGFLAGIGTYKGVLEIAKLEVISKAELANLSQNSSATVSASEKKALHRLVADRFQWSLKESEGKTASHDDAGEDDYDEIQYKRLRKAAFLNLFSFQADSTILKESLESLSKRGYPFVAMHISRLVAELPRIKAVKLRWLEDHAIPALRSDIEYLQQYPMMQRGARASVVLPKFVWILDHSSGNEPEETVQDMSLIEEEVSLLKETI